MPSTFTTNTGIEKIADGEQTGLWGQTTNLNFDIVDRALNGAGAISLSGTTHTLTTSNGVLSDGQFGVLVFGGSPSGTNTVTIAPNTAQKVYWVRNTTAQSVVLTQGSGGNVTVPAGTVKAVYASGAGAGAAVVDLTNVLSMGSPAITGGTINGAVIGAATPAAGAFTTLTATTSLTTPLITNSGTLALSATGANVITASTNGAERLRITSTGNVGVGTSSPTQSLHVVSSNTATARFEGSSSSVQLDLLSDNDASRNINFLSSTGATDSRIAVFNDKSLRLFTDGGERLRIASTGNVGIGTTSPAERLDVNGTVRATGLNLNGTAVTATAAQINEGLAPPGSVIFHSANTAPTGYLKANGALVSRSTYAALFSAIGTTFGAGDGSTTFALPDLRGEFIRGWDDGRGIDSGRAFGSAQSQAIQSHQHAVGGMAATGGISQSLVRTGEGNSATFNTTNLTQNTGGTETRPRNIALLACIKY
jgi:microcystin-dependent protein